MSSAAPPSAPVGPVASAPDGELRRLHPLTPFVRGAQWFGVLAVFVTQQAYDDVPPLWLLGGFALLAVVATAYGFVSWRATRYRFDSGDLRLETGVLFRQSRRVRLDRLQAVDVVRPLLARALGLAELRLEVVGGASSEAPLAYLSEAEAHRLRAELLARAAGLREDTPEAPERVLLSVPTGRLVVSAVLSPAALFGLVPVVIAFAAFAVTREAVVLAALVPGVLAAGGLVYTLVVQQFGFTVAESPDGLRVRRGLLDTRAQTVPPGRVQAVRLVRPLLWRPMGWALVEVNVAGYGLSAGAGTLLPVAPLAEARALVERVLPGVDLDSVNLVPVPSRARWLEPLGWRRLAAGAAADVFVIRRGVLRPVLDVVPHAKTQSVRWTQGPWQRRLGLASVHLDSTPGPVRPVAAHRDAVEALRMVEAEVERSRAARGAAGPERWMTTHAAATDTGLGGAGQQSGQPSGEQGGQPA